MVVLPPDLKVNLCYKLRHHLHSKKKKIEESALLLLDHCPAHPSIDVLKLKHGKIKGMPPSNTATLIQPMDQDII